MMRITCSLFFLAACGSPQAATTPIKAPAALTEDCEPWVDDHSGSVLWEPDGDGDGVQTFKGTVPNSDFFAFKGAGIIEAPIAKVANVLIDTSRHHEWVPNFGGMRVVKQVSEREMIIYRHVTTPFIISDRDFVVKAQISQEKSSGHLLINFSSVENDDAPPLDGKVRGTLHTSGYRMWPVEGGANTMMIFTIHVDPMGAVPAWIVNLFQSNYARSNIKNIREQAAKPDVLEHPKVKEEYVYTNTACADRP